MADSDEEYHSAEEEAITNEPNPNTVRDESVYIDKVENLEDQLRNIHVSEDNEKQTNNAMADDDQVEFVSNLDNRYVSEGVDDVKSEKIELTEEQIKVHQSHIYTVIAKLMHVGWWVWPVQSYICVFIYSITCLTCLYIP